MTDPSSGYDPADQAPAEGQSREIPTEDRGQGLGVDPAAKDAPAEGGRDEVEPGSTRPS